MHCYEMSATALMMAKNFSSSIEELNALNEEIQEIIKLADHCKDILKQLEG
ncbi:MAG: hypothetical protein ACOYN4_00415 [Bacteroidales bacterium]